MNKMDVMIDLETLSTRPNAVILVIAGVKFNRSGNLTELKEMDTFYRRITIDSCLTWGMHTDSDTRKWWDKQDPEIRAEAFGEPREDLFVALREFIAWYGNSRWIWSHGATFDIVIMNEAFRACGMQEPWKFWDCRDTRTLYDIAGIRNNELPQLAKHHALHDCHRQIWGVKMAMKRLGKTRW
jgi:hypothetical protein